MSKSYKLKCRNPKCGSEFHRYWPKEEFEKLQYGGIQKGIGCFNCGYPKMIVAMSNRVVKDGFKPGFQRNIRKHCSTYSEYKAHLKSMGLVEIGYEEHAPGTKIEREFFSDDTIRMLNQKYNLSLSDSEIRKLKEN